MKMIPFPPECRKIPDSDDLVRARQAFNWTDAQQRLVTWYARVARPLPWRSPITPYRVWVSEIMLQQTTVATVLGYFDRFMARFPSVEILADAEERDLLKRWEGLGYYQRARNLHQSAKKIILSGEFPRTKEGWLLLSGVGPSTAGAIASIAFGEKEPILDANVRRVNRRLFHLMEPDLGKGDSDEALWGISRAFVNTLIASPGTVNQALMDLGATVCRIRSPSCGECPFEEVCLTSRFSLDPSLPKRPALSRPTVPRTALVGPADGGVILVMRTGERLLEGLWDFPRGNPSGEAGTPGFGHVLARVSHTYSHFTEDVEVVEVPEVPQDRWVGHGRQFPDCETARAMPLTGVAKKIMKILEKRVEGNDG